MTYKHISKVSLGCSCASQPDREQQPDRRGFLFKTSLTILCFGWLVCSFHLYLSALVMLVNKCFDFHFSILISVQCQSKIWPDDKERFVVDGNFKGLKILIIS